MFISLYQEYESQPQQYRSELMLLFKRTPALQERVTQQQQPRREGNTLEKALNKIGREDIVKKCIFNVELVTDDVEKAVARVRLDQPGFDSLKDELGPSRDTSLRRDATMDPKMDPDYDEPDRMKDSESIEDISTTGGQKIPKQHITITNGTSTPIKDKYASDEKELGDMMADFLEHKYHASETMVKKSRDEIDDDNKKRQQVLEDANKIVSDITEEATKRAQLLADNALTQKQSENDFLQQSEPTFTETTTTEINPETHERVTRITRTTVTSAPLGDESTLKLVEEFISEERKDS